MTAPRGPMTDHWGVAKLVKAPDFDSGIRGFESFLPSHPNAITGSCAHRRARRREGADQEVHGDRKPGAPDDQHDEREHDRRPGDPVAALVVCWDG